MDALYVSFKKMLSVWSWLTFFTFLVMLTHQSNTPILFGRYSALVSLSLAVLLVLFLGSLLARFYLPTSLLSLLDRLKSYLAKHKSVAYILFAFVCASVVVIIFFFLSDFPAQYAILRAYLIITLMMWTIHIMPPNKSLNRYQNIILIFASTLMIIFMVSSAEFYPALARTDEAWVFSTGQNFSETGARNPLIYEDAIPATDYYVGWVWYRVFGSWLNAFGYSLYTGRLFFVFLAIISAGILAWASKRFYDLQTALLVFLLALFALSQQIYIRFDMFALFWGCLSILLYSFAHNKEQLMWHIAIGFTAGMAIDSSPGAANIGAGFALIYGLQNLQRIRKKGWIWPPFWGLAIGGLSAIAVFFASISENSLPPQNTDNNLLIPLNTLSYDHFSNMLSQYLSNFIAHQALIVMIAAIALFLALRSKKEEYRFERYWSLMTIAWIILIVIIYPYFPIYYASFGLFIFILLAARTILAYLPQLSPTGSLTIWGTIILLVWVSADTINNVNSLQSSSLEAVVEVGREISQVVPSNATIVAAEPYYFGMLEHENFVGGAIESVMDSFEGIPPNRSWQIIKPDAFVFSGNWPQEPRRTDTVESYIQTNNFELVGCWLTDSYGVIELWAQPDLLLMPAPLDPCKSVPIPRLMG